MFCGKSHEPGGQSGPLRMIRGLGGEVFMIHFIMKLAGFFLASIKKKSQYFTFQQNIKQVQE